MPLLFSYGTLKEANVQRSTFGRTLSHTQDELVGYGLSIVRVTDASFIASTGKSLHANVVPSGRSDGRVPGVALEVTEEELVLCDRYEAPAHYIRVEADLASARKCWVYTFVGFSQGIAMMPEVTAATFVLAVNDLEKSRAFYCDKG